MDSNNNIITTSADSRFRVYRDDHPRGLRLIIAGHAGSGKDTACEIIEQLTGMTWCSSSWMACQLFVFDILKDWPGYVTPEACHLDRGNFRREWFGLIRAYNAGDGSRLARELFREHQVYCGIRNRAELQAIRADHRTPIDAVIWIDAGQRLPPEDIASNTITADDCDVIVDNNGPERELPRNLAIALLPIVFRCQQANADHPFAKD